MNIVEARNFSKSFSGNVVLKNITFSIGDKGLYAFIGPNGAGKTTMLKSLAGIIPSEGVFIMGRPVMSFRRRELARIISFLPQMLIQTPFSVREFLMFSFYPHNSSGNAYENRIMDVVKALGIDHVLDGFMNSISGGELELVYLASCILQKPKVMVADEPTTFLDPYYRDRVKEILRDIAGCITVIVATHDLEWVKENFDHVFGLRDSSLVINDNVRNVSFYEMMKLFERGSLPKNYDLGNIVHGGC